MDAAAAKQRADSQRGRRECELAVGDKAWLSNRNLRLDAAGRARKLEPLYFGPYEVLAMHGSNAAKLRLPAGCRLHPVFNVDLLKRFVDGCEAFPQRAQGDARPGPLPSEEPAAGGPGDPVYEVEAVIAKRGRGARLQYRVKWLGWPIEQAGWLPVSECDGCAQAVADYERRQLQLQRRVAGIQRQQTCNGEARLQRWLDKLHTQDAQDADWQQGKKIHESRNTQLERDPAPITEATAAYKEPLQGTSASGCGAQLNLGQLRQKIHMQEETMKKIRRESKIVADGRRSLA
jgi:hypothetical protein